MIRNRVPIMFDLHETLIHQNRNDHDLIQCAYLELLRFRSEISFEAFADAWRKAAGVYNRMTELGLDFLRAEEFDAGKEFFREKPYRAHVAATLAILHISSSADLTNAITGTFQDNWKAGLSMAAGYTSVLERLRSQGHPLGLVTNFRQYDVILNILSQFHLGELFQTIVVSVKYGYRKPHPYIFWHALGELDKYGCTASAVYVGDNPVDDIQGSLFAGFHPIMVDTTDKYAMSCKGIDKIRTLAELPEIVGRGLTVVPRSYIRRSAALSVFA